MPTDHRQSGSSRNCHDRPLSWIRVCFRHLAAVLLLTSISHVAPTGIDVDGKPRFQVAHAEEARFDVDDDDDDDDDAYDAESADSNDGSHKLDIIPLAPGLEGLQPLTSAEERKLLGNWGDADDEDGD